MTIHSMDLIEEIGVHRPRLKLSSARFVVVIPVRNFGAEQVSQKLRESPAATIIKHRIIGRANRRPSWNYCNLCHGSLYRCICTFNV